LAALALLGLLCVQDALLAVNSRILPDEEPDYTKGEELPIRWKPISDSVNCGPIGAMAYCWARRDGNDPTHESRMLDVRLVYEGSPAEGKLMPGDVIVGVVSPKIPPYQLYTWTPPGVEPPTEKDYVDATRFPYDVRKALAAAIAEAEKEKHQGRLILNVWRDGGTLPVAIDLPVVGSYSPTSPFDCEKTDALIRMTSDRIRERGIANGSIPAALEGLGLLATGEEKNIRFVKEWVHGNPKFDPKIKEVWRTGDAWSISYELIFLAEYYMATGDEFIKPTLDRFAEIVVRGQSFAGTWSHMMASPEWNYGQDHGITASYGSMNTVTGACSVGLVLAQKAGVKVDGIGKAIDKSLNFLAYFAERGSVPYGDHTPWMGSNENNGKNSQCAVLFDLAGQSREAKYFSKMTLASHRYREQGHTGHFWSTIWGHLGAARAGDQAAQAFTQSLTWFHELERRPDHDYSVQPQLRYGHWKTRHWKTAGIRLLGLCVPRKAIFLTGKGGHSFDPIKGDELLVALDAGGEWPSEEDSIDELFADLGSFSPVVREHAAKALGKKDENLVDRLIELLETSDDPHLRRGAAMGLSYAGRGSEKAVDALIETLESSDDQVLKHFVVRAFQAPSWGNGLASSDAVAKAIPVLLRHATIQDPADPWRKLHNEIASTLFNGNDALAYDRRKDVPRNLDEVDRDLLVAAMKSFLTNVNGYARGWSSKLLKHLDDETLKPLWRDIFLASMLPSPSGVMNHQQVMTHGVELMAEKGYKEGAMLGAIQIRRPGWGEERRVQQIAEILPAFGAEAQPFDGDVVPYIQSLIDEERERAEKRGELRPKDQRKIESLEALISAFSDPLPPKDLKSLAPFLEEGDLKKAQELLEHYPTKTQRWNKSGL
jgi:hypothetical protein